MNLHPGFLSRNLLRNYPLQGRHVLLDQAGGQMPAGLLTAARFTVPAGVTGLYFRQVRHAGRQVSGLVHALPEDVPAGYFGATVTVDFQVLDLVPLRNGFFGRLAVGTLALLDQVDGLHSLSPEIGRVEDSLVVSMPAPAVTGLLVGTRTLTGRVTLRPVNVGVSAEDSRLTLDVLNRRQVLAVNDRSIRHGTCGFLSVGGLNGVTPDAEGNIDLFGIAPLRVTVTPDGQVSISLDGMSQAELCGRTETVPPNVASDVHHAASDLPRTGTPVAPEWRDWPTHVA